MDLELELAPDLDPAALELLPAESGLTGGFTCGFTEVCDPTCGATLSAITCAAQSDLQC